MPLTHPLPSPNRSRNPSFDFLTSVNACQIYKLNYAVTVAQTGTHSDTKQRSFPTMIETKQTKQRNHTLDEPLSGESGQPRKNPT